MHARFLADDRHRATQRPHRSGPGPRARPKPCGMRRASDGVEGLRVLVKEVPPVLDPHRDPHQALRDARAVELARRHLRVRSRRRMAGERFHRAKADRILGDSEAAQKIERRLLSAP